MTLLQSTTGACTTCTDWKLKAGHQHIPIRKESGEQRVDSCTNPATGCIFLCEASRGAFTGQVDGQQTTDGGGGQTPTHHEQNVACCFLMDARFSNDESLGTSLFLACVSVCGKMLWSTPHVDCFVPEMLRKWRSSAESWFAVGQYWAGTVYIWSSASWTGHTL